MRRATATATAQVDGGGEGDGDGDGDCDGDGDGDGNGDGDDGHDDGDDDDADGDSDDGGDENGWRRRRQLGQPTAMVTVTEMAMVMEVFQWELIRRHSSQYIQEEIVPRMMVFQEYVGLIQLQRLRLIVQ